MIRHSQNRPAYSLIELLIVTFVLVSMVGVALPAVQKSREEAARAQCANNLKQIGLALHKYADQHKGGLPPIGGGGATTVFTTLLPYLGHEKISRALAESGRPWYDQANADLVKTRIALYQCPSAPIPERLLTGTIKAGNEFQAAPTDYNGINQITNAIADIFPSDLDRTAALHSSESQKLTQITDGLSNTLAGIVEIADKPNSWRAGKQVKAKVGGNSGNGTWVANTFNSPRGYNADGTMAPGPCAMNCSNSAAIYSFHPEGCNFLFADGSVRFLSKDLDVWIMYAVITRRGGEILAPSDF